jgi:hypothetical protein
MTVFKDMRKTMFTTRELVSLESLKRTINEILEIKKRIEERENGVGTGT